MDCQKVPKKLATFSKYAMTFSTFGTPTSAVFSHSTSPQHAANPANRFRIKSHNLNACSSQLSTTEVRRVRWHPGSANDSHLLVLTSENTFQLYECELGSSPRLMRTWKVGPTPLASPSKYMPTIESLGETAVDFDFATPTLKTENDGKEGGSKNYDWNQIDWPICVLCGNGEVLLVVGNILSGTQSKPVVLGSLTMYPPADDNYGIDSCSIMCIQTTPPIVVIATCTGKIYHAILLKDSFLPEEDETQTRSVYGSTYSLHTPVDALFVVECVELELGLLYSEQDRKYSCPIHLHSDKGNKSRYFCSHNAGIHAITLPMVSQLDEYVGAKDEEADLHLPTSLNPSNSQYLVCTRTKHTVSEDATPVFGFGLLQQPCPVLIALLHTGVVVDLSVVDLDYLPRIDTPKPMVSPNKKITREPFDTYIRNLLKHYSTSQPITKLGTRSKLSAKECLELLYRATHVFRDQHFARLDEVRGEIEKKVRALKALKNHQLKELATLMETRNELQEMAEYLAERYEDIKDTQVELAGRAKEVLKLVNYKEPSMSSSERAEAAELKIMDDKVLELVVRIGQLKKKVENQSKHFETLEKIEKQKELVFSEKQEEAIKTNLKKMGKDISELISQVKVLEEDVDV
ncbi:nuclear pore complex protein Nup88 isoform X2 [Venturia canescens]|uniref:nuclear pore complex protein Nup88 isoform X2 n=1 Tax=Venturia canescens TaxID=32260 RepID=UPI001C9BC0B4|nr:nuclear pore complex protein Nup88 isoform X2 [Venturia canescens]